MTREDIIRMAREAGIPETATEGVFIANSDDLGRLIAAEREWQGLTDDEINTAAYNNHPLDGIRAFARAVESKLKEKNGY
jgi:hypothetical protein